MAEISKKLTQYKSQIFAHLLCFTAAICCVLPAYAQKFSAQKRFHSVHYSFPVVHRSVPRRDVNTVHVQRFRHPVAVHLKQKRAIHVIHHIIEPRAGAKTPSANTHAEERPHLHAALRALLAADYTLHQTDSSGQAALGQLTAARRELDESVANDAYQGRRNKAMICTKRAIEALHQQPPGGDATTMTTEAINHVQFCLQAPI